MSRSQVEGGNRTNVHMSQVEGERQVEGKRFADPLPTNPTEAGETERQRLVDAFWEIYNNYQDEMDRQALRDHVYGILFVLMERPDVRFFVDQEGKVRFIDSRSDETNRARRLVPVETNAEFEEDLQLQTDPKHLEIQRQQLMAELNDYNLAEKEILPDVRNLRNGSLVKRLLLRAFNDSYTYLRRSLRSEERRVGKECCA